MMVSADSFLKAQTPQQMAQLAERNICVGRAAENAGEKVVVLGHIASYTTSAARSLMRTLTRTAFQCRVEHSS